MIDFHSHILPSVDDGCKSVKESIEILSLLYKQGVEKVVATPHFYADNESVNEFLERRTASYESLKPFLTKDMPQIILGAEVRYYQGISRLNDLQKLKINGSDLLLLEMPMCDWTEYTLREVCNISSGNITVALAHIDRYLTFINRDFINEILQGGLLLQANADFFLRFMSRNKAWNMLSNGEIHLIGSDCHNLSSRPPRIDEAFAYIEKKVGKSFVKYINSFQNELLKADK